MQPFSARKTGACRSWIGFHVLDFFGWPVGRLAWLGVPQGKTEAYVVGVRPAWVTAQDLLVPAEGVRVDPARGVARVPYGRDVLYNAPRHPAGVALTPEREREVYVHFGLLVTDASRVDAPEVPDVVSGHSRKADVPLKSKPSSRCRSFPPGKSDVQSPPP